MDNQRLLEAQDLVRRHQAAQQVTVKQRAPAHQEQQWSRQPAQQQVLRLCRAFLVTFK